MPNLELFGVPITNGDPKNRLRGALRGVKAIIFDVDGVLTDGQISFTESGEEIRTFSVRDGLAFREALARGLKLGAISERESKAAFRWLNEFGVTDIVMGTDDKL
ncbi:MAG: 3-deoxy-D-manno-octulosonate 8-phosphate phosphatase, partial [Chlorobiales bacterium]|nr:3-deoxy-D-manno-octulosonate 8-phosphate phosphatase [Chlorobiales bacterium]